MANIIYDSGWIAVPADDSYVNLSHNLGKSPIGLSLEGRISDGQGGYDNGLPEILDGNSDPVEKMKLDQVTHLTQVRVYRPAVYAFAGEIRVRIFE